mmetsp:Transcript_36928/g.97767  ORF Transcript_36928/g.97767 Transcript_36928/m.97767 type:complete len:214 (+) Transcript_36928:778-1419(+)
MEGGSESIHVGAQVLAQTPIAFKLSFELVGAHGSKVRVFDRRVGARDRRGVRLGGAATGRFRCHEPLHGTPATRELLLHVVAVRISLRDEGLALCRVEGLLIGQLHRRQVCGRNRLRHGLGGDLGTTGTINGARRLRRWDDGAIGALAIACRAAARLLPGRVSLHALEARPVVLARRGGRPHRSRAAVGLRSGSVDRVEDKVGVGVGLRIVVV